MGYLVMVILLLVTAFCGLQFLFIEMQAKSSFHQIYASIYLVAAIIAFVGATLAGLIQNSINVIKKLKREVADNGFNKWKIPFFAFYCIVALWIFVKVWISMPHPYEIDYKLTLLATISATIGIIFVFGIIYSYVRSKEKSYQNEIQEPRS